MSRSHCALFVLLLTGAVAGRAQQIEIAGTANVTVSPDGKGLISCGEAIRCSIPPGTIGSASVGGGLSWQGSFAYRLANLRAAALYAELPVSGSPSRSTGLFSEYSSIFLTPSLQFKFLPLGRVSPFASVGGGFAHFHEIRSGASANTGAFQFGGGVDFRTPLRVLSIRAEARDFVTGRPGIEDFASFTSNHFQHIFAGAGFVLKF